MPVIIFSSSELQKADIVSPKPDILPKLLTSLKTHDLILSTKKRLIIDSWSLMSQT